MLEGDCNDKDAAVAPGADEVWYDGIDGDCNGGSDDDADLDGVPSPEDCDDASSAIHPGADEVWYDGVDENCDGLSDDDQDADGVDAGADCDDLDADVHPDAADAWYDGVDTDCAGNDDYDQDGDGFAAADECNDTDASIVPNGLPEVWYDGVDANCDGHSDYDQDYDGYDVDTSGGEDCDDTDAAISIDAREVWYDGIDQDCSGTSDYDQDADGQDTEAWSGGTDCDDVNGTIYLGASETWYDGADSDCSGGSDYDQDGDGDDTPAGGGSDCDDTDAAIHGGMDEQCGNAIDENCDGSVNDIGATGCETFRLDTDADGYGVAASQCTCVASGSYTASNTTDCDDARATVNPGAVETCATAWDDDCDSNANEKDATACTGFYFDGDGDLYGTSVSQCWCSESGSYTASMAGDCNDARSDLNPGEAETCDLEDDDCDGETDEGTTRYYADVDADTYGDDTTARCTTASGYVTLAGDCDDDDVYAFPGADELCDVAQNDCSTAWTEADETGVVSYETAAGVWSDITSTFSGTSTAPIALSLATGSYYFCQGTFYASVNANAKTTTLTAPYGKTETTLSLGVNNGSVVTATNATVSMDGFTITGGKGTAGSGGKRYGGGILSNASTVSSVSIVTISNCDVTGNVADFGAGIAAYGYGDVVLDGTNVDANTANTSGGGISIANGDVTCTDGGANGNTASTEGGGAWFSGNSGTLTSASCDWETNTPDDVAGAGSFTTTSAYALNASFTCSGNGACAP